MIIQDPVALAYALALVTCDRQAKARVVFLVYW